MPRYPDATPDQIRFGNRSKWQLVEEDYGDYSLTYYVTEFGTAAPQYIDPLADRWGNSVERKRAQIKRHIKEQAEKEHLEMLDRETRVMTRAKLETERDFHDNERYRRDVAIAERSKRSLRKQMLPGSNGPASFSTVYIDLSHNV